jgi:acyl dehydratase
MMAEKLMADRNVGDEFRGGSRVITGTELDMFCTISGMRLDAFLNDEAARSLGFKARVVPGPFVFAVVFGLLGELLNGHVHVGTDNMKVLAPLYLYDRVRVEGEVLRRKESSKGDRVFVTWLWAVKNQDDVVIAQGENT